MEAFGPFVVVVVVVHIGHVVVVAGVAMQRQHEGCGLGTVLRDVEPVLPDQAIVQEVDVRGIGRTIAVLDADRPAATLAIEAADAKQVRLALDALVQDGDECGRNVLNEDKMPAAKGHASRSIKERPTTRNVITPTSATHLRCTHLLLPSWRCVPLATPS